MKAGPVDGRCCLRALTTENRLADDLLVTLTADIVSAHVSNNSVSPSDLPVLIEAVYGALDQAGTTPSVSETAKLQPAVQIRRSIMPDYLVCLEDGKKLTLLKRHLATHYQLKPKAYRVKWGLPKDYPMVAPNYRERRSTLAKALGLGRKAGEQAPATNATGKGRKKLGIAIPKPIDDRP